ncbi:MAG: helix-turn-helix domain-containing protein [Jatrophihabitantaceae bacterium]
MPRRRAALRGADPAVDSVLIAVRAAAMYWRDSGSGSGSVDGPTLADHPAPATALDSGAPLLDAAEAAAVVGITDRGVRRAIAAGRLPARQAAGRWLIAEADANRYRDRRKAP